MPYNLAIFHRPVLDEERGKGEAGLEERAVQGRGDIASKQQSSPFRTDYNNLATLIENRRSIRAQVVSPVLEPAPSFVASAVTRSICGTTTKPILPSLSHWDFH
ncbi:hypothetical protein M9H77_28815 [Catharanthus roseus]|uniref:Uncharacterized protein n=1 Tax=Catharanthus roseus TaxID=4058 RepID=A0ACC0AHU7_CATRO|nr:hypothetical protein M9H77_28815 [Catharanthus roseus]